MKVFVINGAPGAGKDQFVTEVKKVFSSKSCYRVFNISTVDEVKRIATECGWDGTKTLSNRKFLSDLKQLLINWNDFVMKDLKLKVAEIKLISNINPIIFIHSRESNEIKRICAEFNAQSIIIRRASVETMATSNKSDSDVLNYDYDIMVNNNGSLFDLHNRAVEFVERYIKK